MPTRNGILIILLFLLESCSFSKQELPLLSKYIDDSGNEVIYKIDNLNFTNQNNETFTEKHVANNIYIANFFFTRCPSICPKMKTVLKDISNTFEKESYFKIISFSIDPEYDNPSVLETYANSTGIPHDKWFFLCGNENELQRATELFRTSFSKKADGIDFYHSSFVALIDNQQYIRGFYDLLETNSVKNLKKDIRRLLK